EIIAFEYQAHGDAAYRALDRNAGIHHRQTPATHRRHRGRAIALRDVAEYTDRVGEILMARQHRMQRAPGELAVADFPASGGTEAAYFTDRIGREIIVQHEALVGEAFQPVEHLLAFLGAQRGGADRLSLAAGEQRRSVRAGQETDHRLNRADLVELAPVDAL